MSAVVKLYHPTSDREVIYAKAKRTPDGYDILWAHFDYKIDGGRWKRIWIENPGQDNNFWRAIAARGYERSDVSMTISEWLDKEEDAREIL